MNALLSVSDKAGLFELAKGLAAYGLNLLSTGGTAKALRQSGVEVTDISKITNFPEILDGRVKTLHPAVHAGLLARRDDPEHLHTLETHDITRIDFLVVNLYPFATTVQQPGCTLEQAIENIDIGGPAMVRSAAKNWRDVVVLTDPKQYADVLAELQKQGEISLKTRFTLAVAAFNHISNYDAAISDYLSSIDITQGLPAPGDTPKCQRFATQANSRFIKLQDLRYGENPHQQAAFYRDLHPMPGSLVTAQQLQGKALSYNNIADADAAWECVKGFENPACVIVKHANPCGVAMGIDSYQAYTKAFRTDSTSAFGGIIAFNRAVDFAVAQALCKQFAEVIIAPGFAADALALLAEKPNVRLLQIRLSQGASTEYNLGIVDIKRVGSGLLMQTADVDCVQPDTVQVVTKARPSTEQLQDLYFAWQVVRFVKSNAIVFCTNTMTLGIGAGQMSRLDSARIASIKAQCADLSLSKSVVASDAFFPFRDGLDVVADAGAACIIQPGGSIRDQEIIDAADERGLIMVFTGVRHFRH